MAIIEAYHGTCFVFSKFDQGKARLVNDFYGGGVAYFTSSREVAKKYAGAMSKAKMIDRRLVYTVNLSLNKIFDVDDSFYGKELVKFFKKNETEKFARSAGLLRYGVDKFDILARLGTGNMELTGDQVFRGLSDGMVSTARARERLKSLGYDSLRYNGGLNMNQAITHDVYLVYDANDITIKSRTLLVKKTIEDNITNDRVPLTVEAT